MPGTGQRGREELALADDRLIQAPPEADPLPEAARGIPARARRLLSGRAWTTAAVIADGLMLVLAVIAALIGANAANVHASAPGLVWIFPPVVVALLAIRGVYRQKITMQYLDEVGHVVGACSVAAMVIIAPVALFAGSASGQAELIARVWAFGMVYAAGSRYVLGITQRRARQERIVAQRTLIVGAGRIGAQVERRLDERPELGLEPIGYIDAFPPSDEQVPGRRAPVLGTPAELDPIVRRPVAQHVVVAFLSSRGSVFFRQRRVGRDGRPFDLLKFRSMRLPGDVRGEGVLAPLPDDTAPGGVEGADRRTAVGRLMRRLSIDELPQLFNVLRGDMSLVGPPPERPEFVELFERRVSRYEDRHRVKAGITGWAPGHGLSGQTSLSDRIEWDNYYIENWSLKLDLKILLLTLSAVFRPVE